MPEDTTVGQRFSQLITHLGLSKNAFAMSLDKTATVIQHLVDERNKPGFDLLRKVFEVYPNVSKDWLLLGIEPMFNEGNESSSEPKQEAKAPALVTEPTPAASVPVAAQPIASSSIVPEPPTPAPTAEQTASVSVPTAAPAPASIPETVAPASAAPSDTSWQTALYTQQMAHQLAMAELRNQHLQEQQRIMQQMMDLMQRQLSR